MCDSNKPAEADQGPALGGAAGAPPQESGAGAANNAHVVGSAYLGNAFASSSNVRDFSAPLTGDVRVWARLSPNSLLAKGGAKVQQCRRRWSDGSWVVSIEGDRWSVWRADDLEKVPGVTAT